MRFFAVAGAALFATSLGGNVYFLRSEHPVPTCTSETDGKTEVVRIKGGLLEVSTIKAPEVFERNTPETILGVEIGSTISRIRVPAVYHYHVELAPEWKVLLKDKTFIVISPAVRPSLPVGIDTAKLEAEASGRWSLFTGEERKAQLQKSITQTLAAKAITPTYVNFQREAARETLKEFVAKWLITQERWKSASSYPIRVFFADEPIQALSSVPQPFAGSL